MTTLPPSAALSILIPINLAPADAIPESPSSLGSLDIDIQSDDENDHEIAEKRLSRYYTTSPIDLGAVIRPQLSCPDFTAGTTRALKTRMQEAPAVPSIPTVHLQKPETQSHPLQDGDENVYPSPQTRIRKKNSFVQIDSVKRGWDESFGEQKMAPRKRHGMFFGRLQGFTPRVVWH
jgi:hypothetical protein